METISRTRTALEWARKAQGRPAQGIGRSSHQMVPTRPPELLTRQGFPYTKVVSPLEGSQQGRFVYDDTQRISLRQLGAEQHPAPMAAPSLRLVAVDTWNCKHTASTLNASRVLRTCPQVLVRICKQGCKAERTITVVFRILVLSFPSLVLV